MTTKPVVIVTGTDLAIEALEMLSDFEVVYTGAKPTEDDLIRLCEQYNPKAIIVRYGKINARIMDAASNLQVISKHGSGIDVIDQVAAKERNIVVKAAVGANAAAVAEHTWALILACAKSVPQLNMRMKAGYWDKATHKSLELAGRMLGLVGLGAIGQRVARIALAFEMKVIAYDPYVKQVMDSIELVDLDSLYRQSDVISLHCPLTDENRKMLNADAFAKMKSNTILVNTARGGLIDESALVQAIEDKIILSAGLDSFDIEPFDVPHPFQIIPNIILSPHIGGVSETAYINMGKGAVNNILDVLK